MKFSDIPKRCFSILTESLLLGGLIVFDGCSVPNVMTGSKDIIKRELSVEFWRTCNESLLGGNGGGEISRGGMIGHIWRHRSNKKKSVK